ncbi:LANO_0E00958g1_1 [Lachancea nothofagi CBS 11611]|uniref:2',3'-cyclic-nucleotide 3'-phosphodiesterase n=1 Tax=Lachancea nothofagi CBS 11611 TaxID=1266666 RepID=A0A1G4JP08_9SACH|nr:LANO_0E00958g1_1 [Lachancea nothofagi CBS 11611]
MGIALWFVPHANSTEYETLQSLILSLQTLFPDAPTFEPHLTITSQLKCNSGAEVQQVLTTCLAAVGAIKPSVKQKEESIVSFSGAGMGKGYFTKVRLICTENKYLMGIAQVIRELFVAETPEEASNWLLQEFRPHVSLVYSEMYHVNQALERIVAQRIEDALDLSLHENAVPGNQNQRSWSFGRQVPGWSLPGTFKVVRCEGPVGEWQVLGSVEV